MASDAAARGQPLAGLASLQLAIDMATRHRDEAGRAVVRADRSHVSAEDQMQQLQGYAAQTESKWSVSAQVLSSPEIVQHYYQFMGRLQQAIELQHSAVAELRRELTAARKVLLDAEVRIASLNNLLDKRSAGMAKLQSMREQRQLDELAAMQHRRMLVESETRGES